MSAAAFDPDFETAFAALSRGARVERDALLAEVTKGCCVYERCGDVPAGGVVVGIDHEPVGDGTGEFTRVFHTLDWIRGEARWHTIPAERVDLETLQPLNTKAVRGLIRDLSRAVARGKGAWKPEHRQFLQVMEDLAGVLG